MSGAEDAAVWLWHVPIRGDFPAESWGVLDSGERARADRFLRREDRCRFVESHAAMRRILADLTGGSAADLPLTVTEDGKPVLAASPLRFNLSHSGDHAVLAASFDAEVGVDVETSAAADSDGIADLVMSAAEKRSYLARPPERRADAFLRLWTRKEAVLKAVGCGLLRDPRAVDVGLGGARDVRTEIDGRVWYLWDFILAPGVPGCLAADKPMTPVRIRTGAR
jgi:4'-phosphopantetheinyl transferase